MLSDQNNIEKFQPAGLDARTVLVSSGKLIQKIKYEGSHKYLTISTNAMYTNNPAVSASIHGEAGHCVPRDTPIIPPI